MAFWEMVFYLVSMVAYALAGGGFIYSFVFKNPRVVSKLTALVAFGFLAQTIAIVARFNATGHLPWSGHYEYTLMGGWFIIAGTLFVGWQNKQLQGLAAGTVPLVLIMLGYGYMQNPGLTPMAASLKTVWLYIHVYFAWLSFGAYSLAMAAGVLFLLKQKSEAQEVPNPAYDRFPSLGRLDELIFRYVVFGFITDTIMISAGAIWAKDLWGSYWAWDPVETWSLISWLTYGITIHLRVTFGWREKRLAWLAVAALSTVIICFFGVNLVVNTSLHVFQVR
ncbi:cytochrome c biogenesis protein CcsA [Geomobilimonas luticola]|uniref:Cytochrome c biogenesis protein CcsA n=1 Tax=Geomobilimonas luticola TaxID=1114878 RepID=A0ABS5SEM6_9BACT|nr:cytochrome c biogenesis protein CcsA [Geomobilimonas luticola]MBT0653823.1 cytochrome c biogenesis protein CcsA [Geomobilimonas luticola]